MAKTKLTPDDLTPAKWDRMLTEADHNWDAYVDCWPPAKSVRYDRATKRVVVQLSNGLRLEIPASKLQGVAAGTERERADVHTIGAGTCLEWRALDQHFSIEGLLTGRFGNKAWMASLSRNPRRTKSEANAAAPMRDNRKSGVSLKAATAQS